MVSRHAKATYEWAGLELRASTSALELSVREHTSRKFFAGNTSALEIVPTTMPMHITHQRQRDKNRTPPRFRVGFPPICIVV